MGHIRFKLKLNWSEILTLFHNGFIYPVFFAHKTAVFKNYLWNLTVKIMDFKKELSIQWVHDVEFKTKTLFSTCFFFIVFVGFILYIYSDCIVNIRVN